jgi:hypothetical protein
MPEPHYVRFASIKTPVDAASLLLDIASSKGTNYSCLFRGTGKIALKILNTSTSQRLLPHSKESLDKSMRKSVYQSLDALNGGRSFLRGNCFETIPPAGMAPCEMLGNSNIECVTRLKSILVDRASTGTSLHDASLGTRGAQCKWLPFSSSCWSRLCPGCKFGLRHLSIEFSVRIPQWTKYTWRDTGNLNWSDQYGYHAEKLQTPTVLWVLLGKRATLDR